MPDQQRFRSYAALEDALIQRSQTLVTQRSPIVVAIAGGSASGKTTVAENIVKRLGLERSVLFSQDLFQLGSDFTERKTSRYKWDDPKNFDLDACLRALNTLSDGLEATVPQFDVVANARQGTKTIPTMPIVVWEGVYAFLTPELQAVSDISVFVEAPYILRLLRRISRFLQRQEIDDITVPARHMLSFVLQADIDYVSTQKAAADVVFEVDPQIIEEEVALFTQRASRHASLMSALPDSDPVGSVVYGGLSFALYTDAFVITSADSQVLYSVPLDPAISLAAQSHWSRIV